MISFRLSHINITEQGLMETENGGCRSRSPLHTTPHTSHNSGGKYTQAEQISSSNVKKLFNNIFVA